MIQRALARQAGDQEQAMSIARTRGPGLLSRDAVHAAMSFGEDNDATRLVLEKKRELQECRKIGFLQRWHEKDERWKEQAKAKIAEAAAAERAKRMAKYSPEMRRFVK